jgi:hypothetical protein
VIEKLKKGEKIDDLAKDSKDPGSKDRGGDLGWANPASFVPPFSAAMTKLEKGKFTEAPVKTDFGWHVILLEDTRELKLPGVDEAKGQIGQQLTAAHWCKSTSTSCAPRPRWSKLTRTKAFHPEYIAAPEYFPKGNHHEAPPVPHRRPDRPHRRSPGFQRPAGCGHTG